MIFPLFVFLSGASWPFSLDGQRRKGASDGHIALRILKRFLILFALGLVYGNFFKFDFAHLRLNSVLGRVGFGWAVAAATLLFCRRLRSVVFWAVGIFAAYTLISWLVPVLSGSYGMMVNENIFKKEGLKIIKALPLLLRWCIYIVLTVIIWEASTSSVNFIYKNL